MIGQFAKGKTAVFIDAANISKELIERAKYVPLPKWRNFIEKFKGPDEPALEV